MFLGGAGVRKSSQHVVIREYNWAAPDKITEAHFRVLVGRKQENCEIGERGELTGWLWSCKYYLRIRRFEPKLTESARSSFPFLARASPAQ